MTAEGLLIKVDRPEVFAFSYSPEVFTTEEQEILNRFCTNTDRPVFVWHNLPQEVVGALFSRYSRTKNSTRRVFLDEFWNAPELGIKHIAAYIEKQEQIGLEAARDKARDFYKRIFAEYGDDSVIQMGSVHIAYEGVSQIVAKAIEDNRLGAYIEKSTRYVSFEQKQPNGHFLYMDVPELEGTPEEEPIRQWNELAFTMYAKHLLVVIEHFRNKFPLEEQTFLDTKTKKELTIFQLTDEDHIKQAKAAYNRAVRAKALDTLRSFLPTTTVTNLGAHFSGQAAEHNINKLLASDHAEVRLIGVMAYEELNKIVPNFLQHVDHAYGQTQRHFMEEMRGSVEDVSQNTVENISKDNWKGSVRLYDWDKDADLRIAAELVYVGQKNGKRLSMPAIMKKLGPIKQAEVETAGFSNTLYTILEKAVPDRGAFGRTRRQKLPRAFEHAFVGADCNLDFGAFRDLQRGRMGTIERQRLSAEETAVPPELKAPELQQVLADYLFLADVTKNLHRIVLDTHGPGVAEYVTLLGNKVRFNIWANLRQWTFMTELRTIDGGHDSYRWAMQSAARQIQKVLPFMKKFMAHVNWKKNCGLGRLKAEFKTEQKLAN